MLRSIANASFFFSTNPPFSLLKPVAGIRCGSPPAFNIVKIYSHTGSTINNGSMADVLEILGPLDSFLSSDAVIYANLLSKCIRSKRFPTTGRSAISHLIKLGFKSKLFVSNNLLDACIKAGLLDDAVKLFEDMPYTDLISWCTIISGHVSHGFDLEAFCTFKRMIKSGLKPNHFVISSVLNACSSARILEHSVLIHCLIMKSGLGINSFVEVGLVGVYAKCGDLNNALKVFYEIPVKSLVSWNAIISGCIQNGSFMEAAQLCLEMLQYGFQMDLVTLRIVMGAGSSLEKLGFCESLHAYSIKIGFSTDCYIIAELVRLLAKFGEVAYMSELFNTVKKPDMSLYSLLISGYNANGCREEAVKLVEKLFDLGMKPKEGAWISILSVCSFMEEGMQIHAFISKAGFSSSISVGNALISVYIRCGEMVEAYKSFLEMKERDAVSWTAIMAGLTHNRHYKKALEAFQNLMKTELRPDGHSIATAINACTGLRAIEEGKQIHSLAIKHGLKFSKFTLASILHMYLKCGHMDSSAKLFADASSPHDLIITNVMLAGYCSNSMPLEAFKLFKKEYQCGLIPDKFSISTMLSACTDARLMMAGKQIHCYVVKNGFEFFDNVVPNAIVKMYAKSGNISSACEFFYNTSRKNILLYEMLIHSYLQHRGSDKDLRHLSQIQQSFSCDNSVAFARILRGSTDSFDVILPKQMHRSIDDVPSDPALPMHQGEEKSHFLPLGHFQGEAEGQNYYIFADVIHFYDDAIFNTFNSSCMAQNGLTQVRPLKAQRLINKSKSAVLAS